MTEKFIPEIYTPLKTSVVGPPAIARQVGGIKILGQKIKTLIFTTDVAIVNNTNADAVLAVYPFTPHPAVMNAISNVATIPVLNGIGGGLTAGSRSAYMGLLAEAVGSMGVVVNAPTSVETIKMINKVVDVPIVGTVVSERQNYAAQIEAGVSILNVSGAAKTPTIIKAIRQKYPQIPIIATGGHDEETILSTIEAGANALTYTPPTNGELFAKKMADYRADLD
ncbi:hydrolase [Latilactobacillus sakei]